MISNSDNKKLKHLNPQKANYETEIMKKRNGPGTVALGHLGGVLKKKAHLIRLQRISRRHLLRNPFARRNIPYLRGNCKEAPRSHQEEEQPCKERPSLSGATSNHLGAAMSDEACPRCPPTPEPRPADQGGDKEEEPRQEDGGRARSYRHGLISVMGRRRAMYDAVAAVPAALGPWGYDFFAVYDGQGGASAAGRCRARMHELVAAEVEAGRAEVEEEEREGVEKEWYWEKVMSASFGKMQEEVVAGHNNGDGGGEMGSTALVVLLGEKEIVVANCGDSRVVLSRAGSAVPLSRDHKGETPDERERMGNTSRHVRNWGHIRFLGLIASSKSNANDVLDPCMEFGPKVTVTERTEQDEFLVVATNGLWDAISSTDACRVVHSIVPGGRYPDPVDGNYANQAAALLAKLAVARGSKDNISVIVVELRQ